jgi:hypothetical protein
MFDLLQEVWHQSKFSLTILEAFQIVENFAVIVSLFIALKTYNVQVRQEKFNNSLSLIKDFTRHIKEVDILILKSVFQNTYESCGAQQGCFVTFHGSQIKHNSVAALFLEEGQGLLVYGTLEITQDISEENLQKQDKGIELGCIRSMAEQLNIVAYEVFKGQIEVRIVYYELNRIIEIMCHLLDIAIETDSDDSYHLKQRFKYLLNMRKKFPPEKFPKISFGELC